MFNRINVNRQDGSRTTVRFPPELWELYVIAVGSEEAAKQDLRQDLYIFSRSSSDLSGYARQHMTDFIRRNLAPSRSQASIQSI